MTPELAVAERLLDTPAVVAIVASRIYEIAAPQSPTPPLVRVQIISDPTGYHLRGEDGARRSRVQVDCYVSEVATSRTDDPGANLSTLWQAVDDALSGHRWTADELTVTGAFRQNRRVLRDPDELRLLRCQLEYFVWSKPS